MKHIIYRIATFAGALIASSFIICADNSSYSETLKKVVESNPGVKAAQAATDAEIAENHVGLSLDNPEVNFAYQWINLRYGEFDKKTLDVSQSFNFATLSGAKGRVADARDIVARSSVNIARRDVAARADELMTEIVYRRRLAEHYDSALNLINTLFAAAEKSHNSGNISMIELNSLRMELNALTTESRLNDIGISSCHKILSSLAGGAPLNWEGQDYMDYQLPANISDWCNGYTSDNPEIANLQAQIRAADSEITLRKREGLPSFSLGYTGEYVKHANYHGVSLGLELPLWANKGRVKAAQLARKAAQIAKENASLEFALQQQELYDKAKALLTMEQETRRLCEECDISAGLKKLFLSGQISVHDYLTQLIPLLELNKKVIETQYEYQAAAAAFRAATINE